MPQIPNPTRFTYASLLPQYARAAKPSAVGSAFSLIMVTLFAFFNNIAVLKNIVNLPFVSADCSASRG
ncbi:MAG: hypothetical protein LBJ12_00880 [Oscillospiraceae bacterium]|jgi:hypothetical protein|nr:hypothetical protein [Oscillospiraceae bacterium]